MDRQEKLAGQHQIQWNGKNSDGKSVIQGFYYFEIRIWDNNQLIYFDRKMIFVN